MRVEEFIKLVKKVERFKIRLAEEDIRGQQRDIILKIYIQELTSRINTNMLKVV